MGFFDKLGRGAGKVVKGFTGKLLVISHDFRPGELVWEYPQRAIPYGSRIIVAPNQAAIIIRSGKVLSVLRQGEWALDTAHVPGLRGVMQELYEGAPLQLRIIFVNVTEKDLAFGGQGNTRDGVPVKYHGRIHVVVPDNDEDIKRFALRIAGEDKTFTTEELEERIRLYINDWVESFLGTFFSIDVHAGKAKVKEMLRGQLAREIQENWYLRVKSLAIDIDIPEEWLEKLRQQGYMQMLSLASTNPQIAQFMQQYDLQRRLMDALREAQGGNVAGLALLIPMLQQFMQQMQAQGQQQQAAQLQQLLQQLQAAASGGATGVAASHQLQTMQPRQPPAGQQPGASQAPRQGYVPRCPYCGKEIPEALAAARPRYCPFCGKELKWCPNGHVAPSEAKYCPICGAPLG